MLPRPAVVQGSLQMVRRVGWSVVSPRCLCVMTPTEPTPHRPLLSMNSCSLADGDKDVKWERKAEILMPIMVKGNGLLRNEGSRER